VTDATCAADKHAAKYQMGAHHHTRILVFCIPLRYTRNKLRSHSLSLEEKKNKRRVPVMWTRPGHIARAPPPHLPKKKKRPSNFLVPEDSFPPHRWPHLTCVLSSTRKQDAATRLAPPKILFVRRRDPHKLHTQPRRPFKSITSLISLQFSRGEEAAGNQSVDRHAEEPRQASGARRR